MQPFDWLCLSTEYHPVGMTQVGWQYHVMISTAYPKRALAQYRPEQLRYYYGVQITTSSRINQALY
jgi:hypothetical protein